MAVITAEDVVESLMNDGTIDAIRSKIINHLKSNEELKNSTLRMVEQSKVLATPGSEKQTKRELFDALRHELESPALERASKFVWDLILDTDPDHGGFGKEINQTVERAFCTLSASQPPLFPPPLPSASDSTSVAEENSSEVVMTERCSRTDGKNWRCAKFCVPSERYCERHMKMKIRNKGKSPKSKKITDSSIPHSSTNRRDDHNRRKRKSTALKVDTCDAPEPACDAAEPSKEPESEPVPELESVSVPVPEPPSL